MARRPDVVCAGGCGKRMWKGSGSLTPGKATCRPCRAQRSGQGVCTNCGITFDAARQATGWRRKTCSAACADSAARLGGALGGAISATRMTLRSCADCSASTTRRGHIPLCTSCAKARRGAHYRRAGARRRGAAIAGPSLTIEQLGARDGWRCHLCRRRVDPSLRAPHPRSRSFDHLIPVSHGGTDAPENLRLAHLRCNVSRGNRGTVQLLLVG